MDERQGPQSAAKGSPRGGSIVMLLDNAFRPDPRVANEARSLAQAGYEVTLLAWDREGQRPRRETWHGVRVERLGPRSRHRLGSRQAVYLLGFWWRAFWRVIGRRPDAVHCHDFNTLPAGWLLAVVTGCRLVYDAHESYADMLGPNVAGWIKRLVAWLERRLIGRADAALTVGELLAEELERRGARRTWVVGNWKSLEDFDFGEAELRAARRELGFGDGLLVSYIGWLNADRGVAPLLEAAGELEGVGLLVGGDGPLAGAVAEAAERGGGIRYLGFVDPGRIPLYTSVSDVVYYGLDTCNPNARYSAPNKLFEALAAGKAVVCNDCGEVGRIVRQEACGRVVPALSRQALAAALDELRNPQELARCQARARAAGQQRYNWARAERQLLDLYRAIGLPPAVGRRTDGAEEDSR
ncbi:MAG: glycosyltransferase [Candidatus Brocadiia bacterium]